jgi:hypothetical protein
MAKTKRQMKIPGTEAKKLVDLDRAAESYVEARDERMARTEAEVETRDALIAAMKENGLTTYRDDDADPPLLVTLTPGEDKVKVTKIEEEEATE